MTNIRNIHNKSTTEFTEFHIQNNNPPTQTKTLQKTNEPIQHVFNPTFSQILHMNFP